MIYYILAALFSLYGLGIIILCSFKIYTLNCYLLLEDHYFKLIRKHNYCTCQRFGTHCQMRKHINILNQHINIYIKDLNNVQWTLNKWTFGIL